MDPISNTKDPVHYTGSNPLRPKHAEEQIRRASHQTSTKTGPTVQPMVGKQVIEKTASPLRVEAATGAVSLNIPISIPAGRSGSTTPPLELTYNSHGGDGAFGLGWTLPLGAISRKTSRHIPRYTNEDVFVLSGAEDLVELTDHPATMRDGYSIQRYAPRVQINDAAIRVERWTRCDNPKESFWRTLSGDGLTTIYGRTAEDRITDPDDRNHHRTFSWLISTMYDIKGNQTIYSYKAEDSTNVDTAKICEHHRTPHSRAAQKYLKHIKYGNRNPLNDFRTWMMRPSEWEDALFEIVFDYGEHGTDIPSVHETLPWQARCHPFSSYNAGFELRTYRLCHRVLVFQHFLKSCPAGDLVSSVELSYQETPSGSTLTSFRQKAHRSLPGNSNPLTQSMPTWEFRYSSARVNGVSGSEILPVEVDISQLPINPLLKGQGRTFWLDLDCEGCPGIAAELAGGGWVYLRNESQNADPPRVTFGSPQHQLHMPNALTQTEGHFTQLAADGMLQWVVMDQSSLHGYHERDVSGAGWDRFVPFSQIPSVDIKNGMHWMDLCGSGRSDLVRYMADDHNCLLWYPSLERAGFGAAKLEGDGPEVPRNEAISSGLLKADMTGDGLEDAVLIRNSSIIYWPNMGHGRFGSKVQMDNCPPLDSCDAFNISRVLLADVTGSGCADLIYLIPGGGANLYWNRFGNGWSEPTFIPAIPELSSIVSISIEDALGHGLPCLCWTTAYSARPSLYYVELTGNLKSGKLIGFSNGKGVDATIDYTPSTKFYLQDEQNGQPWRTKVPFPVQCVSRIETRDYVAETMATSTYTYHDGFYDSTEREFRGFGQVDCWDSEDLSVIPGSHRVRKPPKYTRLWFHTGSPFGVGRKSAIWNHLHFRIGDCELPSDATASKCHQEANRALKGLALRTEIYNNNPGTGQSDLRVPLTITDQNYSVLLEREPRPTSTRINGDSVEYETPHGCFRVLPRESLTVNLEGSLESEARLDHTLSLAFNEYGQCKRAATVHYGRRGPTENMEAAAKMTQQQTTIEYVEHDLTNSIEEDDVFRLAQLAETRTYQLRGVQAPAETIIFSYASLTANDGEFFSKVPEVPFELDPEPAALSHPCKVLVSRERSYYRAADMSARLERGRLQALSTHDQTYTLALTVGLRSKSMKTRDQPLLCSGMSERQGGYVDLDNDGCWWIPGNEGRFSDPRLCPSAMDELLAARNQFYIPTYSIDPRGAVHHDELDPYCLLTTRSTDSLGNSTTFENDYISLKPTCVTDANGNRTMFAYDCFGDKVGIAARGKKNESIGDSLDSFEAVLTDDQVSSFFRDPLGTAPLLLGSAGTRIIYHRSNLRRVPWFTSEIKRDTHALVASSSNISITVTYLDGRGNRVQTAVLHNVGPNPEWRLEQWKIFDLADRQPALQFRPCFVADHCYRRRSDMSQELLPPVVRSIFDPRGRRVAMLSPDHTWNTFTFSSWAVAHRDAGDNILVEDMTLDSNIGGYVAAALGPDFSESSWYSMHSRPLSPVTDRHAAEKSKVYHDTPDLEHLDAAGRPILFVASQGCSSEQRAFVQLDAGGNVKRTLDTLGREVSRSLYDLVGRCIYREEMDGKIDWILPDALGQDWLSWSIGDRVIRTRTEHDHLGRPTNLWVRPGLTESELLVVCHEYGEQQPNAEANNLRHQLYRTWDQSGASTNLVYDFKRNCKHHETRLSTHHTKLLDWSGSPVLREQLLDSETYVEQTEFDALDRPYLVTAIDGSRIQYSYNASGAVVSIRAQAKSTGNWTPYITGVSYTPDGQRRKIQYGNGTRASHTYDPLTSLETRRKISKKVGQKTVTLQDVHTTYDCLARQVHRIDKAQQNIYFRNQVIQPLNEYTYNASGQLIVATGREQVRPGSEALEPYTSRCYHQKEVCSNALLSAYTDSMQYDGAGNILQVQHESSDPKLSGWTRSYVYSESSLIEDQQPRCNNRLTKTCVRGIEEHYTYNTRGSIVSMPGITSLSWDYADQLQSTTSHIAHDSEVDDDNTRSTVPETTWYVYNANGTRIRKVTQRASHSTEVKPILKETLYLGHFVDCQIYRTFSGSTGQVKSELKTLEIAIDSTLAAMVEELFSPGTRQMSIVRYQVSDNLELDSDGNVVSYEEYSPYGSNTYQARNSATPRKYRFFGYQYDSENGLYQCHKRYYAAWIGRWISTDPLGVVGGLNLYAYTDGDPVNLVDHEGTTPNLPSSARVKPKTSQWGDRARGELLPDSRPPGPRLIRSTSAHPDLAIGRDRVNIPLSEIRFSQDSISPNFSNRSMIPREAMQFLFEGQSSRARGGDFRDTVTREIAALQWNSRAGPGPELDARKFEENIRSFPRIKVRVDAGEYKTYDNRRTHTFKEAANGLSVNVPVTVIQKRGALDQRFKETTQNGGIAIHVRGSNIPPVQPRVSRPRSKSLPAIHTS